MALIVNNVYATASSTENLSRNDMLAWVNECLQSEYSKIEQLHTGAGYCLFTGILFPGTMQLKRVKWNSRLELDWLNNWKLTQTAWQQIGVDKIVPVEKLIKGKFQDNFEFLQWFKKFFDANYDGHEYNPMEMRAYEELPSDSKGKPGATSAAPTRGAGLRVPQQSQQKSSTSSTYKPVPSAHPQRAGSNASVNSSGAAPTAAKKPSAPTMARPAPGSGGHTAATKPKVPAALSGGGTSHHQPRSPAGVDIQAFEEMKRELEETRQQLAESDDVVAGLEKERDFYFKKLRAVELMCQENEGAGAMEISKILEVLYETEEGFAPPEDAEVEGGVNGSSGNEY